MTIVELKKDLAEALVSLNRGDSVTAPPRCGTSPLRKRVPSTGSVVQRSQTFRNPQTRLSPAE
jgi:hypothetical protein